jgi:hypothetical protein
MTLSLVDVTNEFLSFANVMLLVGCRFDAVNSDMTIGGDVGEARGDAKYRVWGTEEDKRPPYNPKWAEPISNGISGGPSGRGNEREEKKHNAWALELRPAL